MEPHEAPRHCDSPWVSELVDECFWKRMGNMPWGICVLLFFFYQGLREAPEQAEDKMRDTTS